MRTMPLMRCEWVSLSENPLMIEYHDKEWGVPVHKDRTLFEFLTLEGAQAGLSWSTILNKRENYRRAFNRFEPSIAAKYSTKDVQRLLKDQGIVRNRLKIQSTITNAQKFQDTAREFGTFDKYIWRFVNGHPIDHKVKSLQSIPATIEESDALSKDLKKRGFRFVGSTICYAFMQAVGMVNDHTTDCFRYKDLS